MIPASVEIKVLDHGFVRLVESMGSDLSIVRAARCSYDAAWRAGEDEGSDARLINYLVRNHHTTPLEAVEFQFEVKAPIFVMRQWHRHRTWTYNEISARYRELPEEFYLPQWDSVAAQSKDNKQGREEKAMPTLVAGEAVDLMEATAKASFKAYRQLLKMGVARELARSVLPVSTYSHMFAKVDLHNLLHFLSLRLHPYAQYEIRVYAEALLTLARSVVPVSVQAWEATQDGG